MFHDDTCNPTEKEIKWNKTCVNARGRVASARSAVLSGGGVCHPDLVKGVPPTKRIKHEFNPSPQPGQDGIPLPPRPGQDGIPPPPPLGKVRMGYPLSQVRMWYSPGQVRMGYPTPTPGQVRMGYPPPPPARSGCDTLPARSGWDNPPPHPRPGQDGVGAGDALLPRTNFVICSPYWQVLLFIYF